MNKVKIWVERFLDFDQSSKVTGNIYRIETAAEKPNLIIQERNVIIPVAKTGVREDEVRPLEQSLGPGQYLVEAFLPDGEKLQQQVTLKDQDEEVRLQGSTASSQHEWYSWESFQGKPLPVSSSFRQKRETEQEDKSGPPPAVHAVNLAGFPLAGKNNYTGNLPLFSRWDYMLSLIKSKQAPLQLINNAIYLSQNQIGAGGTLLNTVVAKCDPLVTVRHFAFQKPAFPVDPGIPVNYLESRNSRYWTVLSVESNAREIASLPLPWIQSDHNGEATVDLLVYQSRADEMASTGSSASSLSSVTVRDRGLGGVLGYMISGDRDRASVIAAQAKDALYEKSENPLAAAAGGYVLLDQARNSDERQKADWNRWIYNLMDMYYWMPDGAVQHGWLKWQFGEQEEARRSFLTAFNRGIPFYSTGVRWLYDGLALLEEDTEADGRQDDDVKKALAIVRLVARHTRVDQVFTVVKVGSY
jgi:hypothetical protein